MANTERNTAQLPNCLTDDRVVAKMLGVSGVTVRIWRMKGKGPRWVKVGSRVRYDLADVRAWIESQKRGGELAAKAG